MISKKYFVIFSLLIILAGIGTILYACNVPVFRYALERWSADPYQLIIYYENELTQAEQGLIDSLEKSATDSLLNIDVTIRQISKGQQQQNLTDVDSFPWMVLHYPVSAKIRGELWSGNLSDENVKHLSQSPKRSSIAEKLINGDAAVWVLLECNDMEKNNAARVVLGKSLERMSKELKIPTIGYDIEGNPIQVEDFKDYDVSFSLLSLDRQDPSETVLINMLLSSEEDLIYFNEPIAFPVFGRGRALYGLIGKGLNDKNIEYACHSIIGWCSCEIKDDNPGLDLLLYQDWSSPVGGTLVKNEPIPPLTGISTFVEESDSSQEHKPDPLLETKIEIKDTLLTDTIDTPLITISDVIVDTLYTKSSANPFLKSMVLFFTIGLVLVGGVSLVILKRK